MSDVFTNVKPKPLFVDKGKLNGSDYLKDLRKLSVGVGSQVVRADRSGLWAGGNKFDDAPFRIDMAGNMYSESSNGKMVRDTENNRDVIYDDNGIPVILIGYQQNGF